MPQTRPPARVSAYKAVAWRIRPDRAGMPRTRAGRWLVSGAATRYGRAHGITVIDGGYPCKFGPTADGGHKAMRAVFSLTGHVPRRV